MEKFNEGLDKAYSFIMVVATAALIIMAIYQVSARYFFGWGITWTEESMRYIYVAIIMLGIGYLTKTGGFATITLLTDKVDRASKSGGKILHIFQHLVQIIFYCILLYLGTKLMLQAGNKLSAATRIPFSLIYLPIPIGALMGLFNCLALFVKEMRPEKVAKGEKPNGI